MVAENANVSMFDIRQILEEIKEYVKIPREEIIDFILQDKKDNSTSFYYRNMLLQLVDIEALEGIFEAYNKISDSRDGSLEECLGVFCYGETEELGKIIGFAESIDGIEWKDRERLSTLCREWDELLTKKVTTKSTKEKVDDKQNELEELKEREKELNGSGKEVERRNLQRNIKRVEQEIIKLSNRMEQEEFFGVDLEQQLKLLKEKECKLTGIKKFTQGRRLQREIQEIEEEIAADEEYCFTKTNEKKQQAIEKEKEVRKIFVESGNMELGEKFVQGFLNSKNRMGFSIEYLQNVPKALNIIRNEVYSITQTMECLPDCMKMMHEGAELSDICTKIRTQMSQANCRANGNSLEIGIRDRNIPDTNTIGRRASKVNVLADDFNALNEQFQETMSEGNEEEFIKKSAHFHFDFVKVHPFTDANGRTSRILTSMMFATRNYIFPSLYITNSGKNQIYRESDKAVRGDYSSVERVFFERLGHFYPLVIPQCEKKVTRSDLQGNYELVSTIDRSDAVRQIRNEERINHNIREDVPEV